MMKQLGAILALGVACSFILAIALTPAFLCVFRDPDEKLYRRLKNDWMAKAFESGEHFVFRHYRLWTLVGAAFLCFLVAGIPRVGSDALVLRMLSDSTDVAQDLEFVDRQLASIHSMELIVDAGDGAYRKPHAWKTIAEVVKALKGLKEVVSVDSPLGMLRYLQKIFSNPGESEKDLFANPKLVPQLLAVVSLNAEGKRILSRYLDETFGKMRISVRIRKDPSTTLVHTAERIEERAKEAADPNDKVFLTGYLAVFADQAYYVAQKQKMSFWIALACITFLMIVQLRSGLLGFLSLVPNLFPVAVIFGLMGWLGIPLDPVTVFAAAVSIGLSVDDTIHYLTQVKREIQLGGDGADIRECLMRAYRVTGKALLSTSAVLFFGLLSLIHSPFAPISCFGFLGAVAVFTALVADLVFLPALILTFPRIGKLLTG
jgi:predicted RND superfamily exporter protein